MVQKKKKMNRKRNIIKVKWLSSPEAKYYGRILVMYDDKTFKEVNVNLHGKNKVKKYSIYYYDFDCTYINPFDPCDIHIFRYKSVFDINSFKGTNTRSLNKYLKEKEQEWVALIEEEETSWKRVEEALEKQQRRA